MNNNNSTYTYVKRTSMLLGLLSFCVLLSCLGSKNTLIRYYKTLPEIEIGTTKDEVLDPAIFACVPDVTRLKMLEDSISPMKFEAIDEEQREGFQEMDAIEFIAEKSKQHQFVILNESHHYPSHRMFATKLLIELKKQGYTYLGVESLGTNTDFKQPKYVYSDLGPYINEPTFGNFIRKAIELEFEIFLYESYQSERDKEQAKNIANYLYKKEGKVFIYCGYSHGNEDPDTRGYRSMASYLKRLLNIDPLTIDQVYYNHTSFIEGQETKVLVDSAGESYKPFNYNDIFIFHPNYDYSNNRVNWKLTEETKWVQVATSFSHDNYPLIALAYKNKKERKNGAVPIDVVEIQSSEEIEWLCVPKDEEYEIYIFNRKREILKL